MLAGSAGGPYTVTFAAALAQNIYPITCDFSSLATPANANLKNGYRNLALHRDAMILAVRAFAPTPVGAGVDSFTAVVTFGTGPACRAGRFPGFPAPG